MSFLHFNREISSHVSEVAAPSPQDQDANVQPNCVTPINEETLLTEKSDIDRSTPPWKFQRSCSTRKKVCKANGNSEAADYKRQPATGTGTIKLFR